MSSVEEMAAYIAADTGTRAEDVALVVARIVVAEAAGDTAGADAAMLELGRLVYAASETPDPDAPIGAPGDVPEDEPPSLPSQDEPDTGVDQDEEPDDGELGLGGPGDVKETAG